MHKMRTDEVKQYLEENPNESAYGMLYDVDRGIEKRFARATLTLVEILRDVRKTFPEASYYTASGGLNLLLGKSHQDGIRCEANTELVALSANSRLSVGDGDW